MVIVKAGKKNKRPNKQNWHKLNARKILECSTTSAGGKMNVANRPKAIDFLLARAL